MLHFNTNDTAVVLIDHQVGTNTWAATTPLALLQRNVIILAKFAKGVGMPPRAVMGREREQRRRVIEQEVAKLRKADPYMPHRQATAVIKQAYPFSSSWSFPFCSSFQHVFHQSVSLQQMS